MLGFPVVRGVAVAVFVLLVVPRNIGDPDIWWHLRNAQILFATHHFITHDTFSFTALNSPWMNHEWISELPFYLGWKLDGGRGVYWAMMVQIELITVGIYWLSYKRSGSAVGSLLMAIAGTFLSSISYGPRTLLAGWILLLIELWILDESRRRPKVVWFLVPLYMLWVNTHGSWMIGLTLLGAYVATSAVQFDWGAIRSLGMKPEELQRIVMACVASVAALFVNPYGWRLVAYPFNMAFHQKLNIANVEEWRSLDFHSPRGHLTLALLAVAAVWQLYGRRRWELYELAFLAIGIYSAFSYSRFLFLFSLLAAPIFAKRFPKPVRGPDYGPKPFLNGAVLVCLLASCWRAFLPTKVDDQKAMPEFPVDATPFLQSFHPQGNVFNDYLWGGYMIWNMRDWPVFVDSRVDIFEYNGTFKDYLDIVRIQNTMELLDQHQIRYVLFEKDTPLIYLLQKAGGWKVDYDKGNVILLERIGAVPGLK